ncbi:MAG: NAD(+)/NADH kinase [Deltaproteobacteria bacterium]
MANIGLVLKRGAPHATDAARPVVDWCREQGHEVFTEPDAAATLGVESLSKAGMFDRVDAIVVLGGDGTLLATARLSGEREVPLIGVNLGTLGFLAETTEGELEGVLARTLAGEAKVDRRRMLHATVEMATGRTTTHQALNDAVLSRGALGRTIDIEAHIDGAYLARFNADGLIVSTPTGSTAYNLSAGGPLIHPSVRVMLLSPICPHTLSIRPIVVDDGSRLELRLGNSREGLLLTLDGQETVSLSPADRVVITRSPYAACLVTAADLSYYDLLRTKLGWAVR